MKVYAINGVSLSGKDTFCNFVKNAYVLERHGDKNISLELALNYHGKLIRTISTIDPVKEIYASFFKWDFTKSDIHRKNLNTLKQIWIEVSDGPSEWLKKELHILSKLEGCYMVFVMVREFDEMRNTINIAKDICGDAETIQIVRHGIPIPPIEQEFLDSHPKDYVYDWTIVNPTVDTFPVVPNLKKAAEAFVKLSKTKTGSHNPVVWNPVDEQFVEWVYNGK